MWGFDRKTADINYFGREPTQKDWKEVQACHSIVLNSIVSILRENTRDFATFHFLTMFDIRTFFWRLFDLSGNPKPAYFVMITSKSGYCAI